MGKKEFIAATLLSALPPTGIQAQNIQSNGHLDNITKEISDKTHKISTIEQILDFYRNILANEDNYERNLRSSEMKILRGKLSEIDSIKHEMQNNSMKCINDRVALILMACPELQSKQVDTFVNTYFDRENSINQFKSSIKNMNSGDKYDFVKKISEFRFLTKEAVQLDFLKPDAIKIISEKAKIARIEAMNDPDNYDKQDRCDFLQVDINKLKNLQSTIKTAKVNGGQFNENLLKKVIIASYQAHNTHIEDYQHTDTQTKIVDESEAVIAKMAQNMGRNGMLPQYHFYSPTKDDSTTLKWKQAVLIAKQSGVEK